MPQIAQQDYLRIPVNGFEDTDIKAALPQEKATELAQRGVLLDVILVRQDEQYVAEARIVSYTTDKESGNVISFNFVDEGAKLVEY